MGPSKFALDPSKNVIDQSEDIIICIDFACNLKCPGCWLDGFRANLKPYSYEEFKDILLESIALRGTKRLILSGGEVTLNKNLTDYVTFARQQNSIKHVRIQTNARKLADKAFCNSLINSGIDEYYISLWGHSADIHERHTLVKNSFQQTIQALNNLLELNADIWIASPVTKLNYHRLPELLELTASFRLRQLQLLIYMTLNRHDPHDLSASHLEVRPFLLKTLKRSREINQDTIVKYYPECLLGEYKSHLDNTTPLLMIDPIFDERNADTLIHTCPFKTVCPSEKCWGIALSQQKKFGVRGYTEHAIKCLPIDFTQHSEQNEINIYLSHHEKFKAQHPFLPLFENLLVQSRNISVIPSIKIESNQCYAACFDLIYQDTIHAKSIQLIFNSLKLSNLCPEIQLNFEPIKTLFSKGSKTKDLVKIRSGIVLKDTLDDSCWKLIYYLNDLSNISDIWRRKLDICNISTEPNQYYIEIGLFFNNITKLKLFKMYKSKAFQSGILQDQLIGYANKKFVDLINLSESFSIGIDESRAEQFLSFYVDRAEQFINILNWPQLSELRNRILKIYQYKKDIRQITLVKSELINDCFKTTDVYY